MNDLQLEIKYTKYLIRKRKLTSDLIKTLDEQIKESKLKVEKLKEQNENKAKCRN